jgi:hypothetical protein
MKHHYPKIEICGADTKQRVSAVGPLGDEPNPDHPDYLRGFKKLEHDMTYPESGRVVYTVRAGADNKPLAFVIAEHASHLRGDLVELATNPAPRASREDLGRLLPLERTHVIYIRTWCGFKLFGGEVSKRLFQLAVAHMRAQKLSLPRAASNMTSLVIAGLGRHFSTGAVYVGDDRRSIDSALWKKVYKAKFGMNPVGCLVKWNSDTGRIMEDVFMKHILGFTDANHKVITTGVPTTPEVHYAFLPRDDQGRYVIPAELAKRAAFGKSIKPTLDQSLDPAQPARFIKDLDTFNKFIRELNPEDPQLDFYNQIGDEILLIGNANSIM